MSYTKRYRTPTWLACLVTLWVVMLWLGCSVPSESPTGESPATESSVSHFSWHGPMYVGKAPLDAMIVHSDVVARVRFISARQVVEPRDISTETEAARIVYVHATEFTFQVLEYLKGSGAAEIKVLAFDGTEEYRTVADAEAEGSDILASRDTRWDDREAVVMLSKSRAFPKTITDADRYAIGYGKLSRGGDTYTVSSIWGPKWLPDAAAPATASDGVSRAVEGEQRFLVEPPVSASGQTRSAGAGTITTGGLNAIIRRLQAEIDAGGGVPGYERCVQHKYQLQFEVDNLRNPIDRKRFLKRIDSGIPAGTVVYDGDEDGRRVEIHGPTEPENYEDLVVRSGQDADLFGKQWPFLAVTARPLPAGEYRFYSTGQPRIYSLCDAWPEEYKTRYEIVVTVTAPENTLHEAFFDPVTLASGVGADSSNGVIKPAGFTVDGTLTSVTSLKYDDGNVVLSLSPHVSLSGQKLDFIELDGSVGLSLEVSSATEDSTAGTFTWAVSEEPWGDGDLLMLRVAASTASPAATATPEPTPTPGSASAVTITLNPRVTTYATYTDITVAWTDSLSCQGSYFVAVFNNSASAVRILGFHSAPATTTLTAELDLHWDTVPIFDWTVGVRCDPSDYSIKSWMVGEVTLQSGLPTTP